MVEILRRVLRENEVRAATGYSHSTLWEKIQRGRFSAPIKDGKLTLWLETDVAKHQQALLDEREERRRQIDENAPAWGRA